MNQKLSWTLLIGGLTFFLVQFAELLSKHSTVGASWRRRPRRRTMLRLLAAAIPMVAGAFGVQQQGQPSRGSRDDARGNVIERGTSHAAGRGRAGVHALLLPVLVATPGVRDGGHRGDECAARGAVRATRCR
jgi:hypothetical protein